jgi:alkylation response protein AidB-like acyl-CoA dehydrogenase
VDFSPIEFDDDLRRFRDDEVRPFLDEQLTDDVLARERHEGNGFDPAYQRALAARGWLELWLADGPTSDGLGGDGGLDAVRAAVFDVEQAARVGPLFPVQGSHALVMQVVRQFASDELKAELADRVHAGEVQACLGYTEPDCGSDAAAIRTRATRDGDEWRITGQKMFSTGAHLCQFVMLTARTNLDAPKHQGITMFLVPLDQPGVAVEGIGTLGGERTNFVYLDDARVADRYRLGPVDQGWAIASGALAAEHGMGNASTADHRTDDLRNVIASTAGWQGTLRDVLAAAEHWATTTTRPDGSRVIDDPMVRVRLARIALDCAVSEFTPNPFRRVIASDVFIRDVADLVELIGPAALIPEGEDGAVEDGRIEWAHRFAQGTSIYGGTTDIQRNLIAEHVLGLPRHRAVLRR